MWGDHDMHVVCGAAVSWPGLVTILIRVNKAEIAKKTVNQEPFRLLKAVVAAASSARRSGVSLIAEA